MNSACPICNTKEHKIFGSPKTNSISVVFIDKPYVVVQCANCLVYYVMPKISFTDDQWSKMYNNEYFSLQSNWLIRKREIELKQRFDRALNYLSTTNINFLDIGAGEGKSLIEGLKRGWSVTGIDIVDNRINAAKNEKIKFITAKFLEHNFQEKQFDFIYLDSVLEHVINPKEYLLKIREILKMGGIVYIGVPNEDSLFNDVRRLVFNFIGKKNISTKIKPFVSPYHIIGFNNKSLEYISSEVNFDVKLLRNFGRKLNFLSHPPNQKGFWIGLLFLFPIEILGNLLGKDVYFQLYITKKS